MFIYVPSLDLTMSQYTFNLFIYLFIVTEINTSFVNNHYSLSHFSGVHFHL